MPPSKLERARHTPREQYLSMVEAVEVMEKRLRVQPADAFAKARLAQLYPEAEAACKRMKASENLEPLRQRLRDTSPSEENAHTTALDTLVHNLTAAGEDEEARDHLHAEIERLQALPRAKRKVWKLRLEHVVEWYNQIQQGLNRRGPCPPTP